MKLNYSSVKNNLGLNMKINHQDFVEYVSLNIYFLTSRKIADACYFGYYTLMTTYYLSTIFKKRYNQYPNNEGE